MLKDIEGIKIQGANFEQMTQLSLFREGDNSAKATMLYGRNGSGKSTVARAFREAKGFPTDIIRKASLLNNQGKDLALTDEEKAHIHVFDEYFVNENVRVQEDGLGSIVMLGEQAGLTKLIETATEDLRIAEKDQKQKEATLEEYNNPSNAKSPRYYINKMYAVLQQDNGWAGRKRTIEQLRRNASVSDNTYKDFINLSPHKSRDELIVDYDREIKLLTEAQSGTAIIPESVPVVHSSFKMFEIEAANTLLKQVIERPELTEREQYLLELVQTGHGEDLKETAQEFSSPDIVVCPKCHQPVSEQYKHKLIESIQKVLSEDVKNHQNSIGALIIPEMEIALDPFQKLSSYQSCVDQIAAINLLIQDNNLLLQSKIDNPYTPVEDELSDFSGAISILEEKLGQLEKDRVAHNHTVTDTGPIKERLETINDEIAYWDVINLSIQHDERQAEKEKAERDFETAQIICKEKQNRLSELNSQRDSIDIAIDIINDGLKYIFFSNDRMQIHVEDKKYRLICNGHPVKPKNVSVGERNIIGLCYYFASILEKKSRETGYSEEYLLVIDDPVSSYDLENRVGILSYLKNELGKFFLGNANTRALIMTHDLFTAIDVGKICHELMVDCNQKFNGQGDFIYSPKELRNNQIVRFENKRNEYTTLLKTVYDYASGGATEQELYIGNIIRQVLEAFSTFEYRKSIEEVSVDDEILASMKCEEHRTYFKNLMYRLVLNEGSHKYNQTRNMQIDFFSIISEPDKRRTAKEILCFMELLNTPHIRAHLGIEATKTIDGWCEEITSVQ